MHMQSSKVLALVLSILPSVYSYTVDLTNQDQVKSTLSSLAFDMLTPYVGNQTGQTPGILPGPCSDSPLCYYWWEAGAMWGALINYWQYTGDTTYNDVVTQGLTFQIGPDKNYNPPNQSSDMGIDDQAFWAFSALDAAEANFPPSTDPDMPSWLELAQGVYHFQLAYWDKATCGGGMRWQVFSFNKGYNLKNAISNGGNFQLAARLARYTGNQTYAAWAEQMWDWMAASTLFETLNGTLYIWDNTDADTNCTSVQNFAWSYNYGTMMMGAAYMYAATNNSVWQDRTWQILQSSMTLFFPQQYGGKVMSEFECEETKVCNNDQKSFKAYYARWLAVTAQLVPSTASTIQPLLAGSAKAAMGQCDGGNNGRMCGTQWYTTTWDGTSGVGQQMSALSVLGTQLMTKAQTPLTATTGGNSTSDPNAGAGSNTDSTPVFKAITAGDKAGAAILTILLVIMIIGGTVWIVI